MCTCASAPPNSMTATQSPKRGGDYCAMASSQGVCLGRVEGGEKEWWFRVWLCGSKCHDVVFSNSRCQPHALIPHVYEGQSRVCFKSCILLEGQQVCWCWASSVPNVIKSTSKDGGVVCTHCYHSAACVLFHVNVVDVHAIHGQLENGWQWFNCQRTKKRREWALLFNLLDECLKKMWICVFCQRKKIET